MTKKLLITVLAGILLYAASGTLHAQGQTTGSINQNSQSFTQKVNMNNIGNKDGTYYLLLCKMLPNATPKIMGAITFESATQDSIPNICNIEVLCDDNKTSINNQCNVVGARMVTVQYGRDEYLAVELMDIMDVSDISFTGYAENKSLLLVNENQIAIIDDTIGNGTRAGDPWDTSGNNIYATNTSANVGIGTINPAVKLHVVGSMYLGGTASIGRSGSSYDEFGYNIGFTNTNNVYTYRGSNFAASIRMGNNGSIEFRTAPSGTTGSNLTLTARMRILEDGNVGIGTSNPAVKLHVVGNTYLGATASIGRSGNQYDEFGYNVGFTSTSQSYTYRVGDYAASIRMGTYGAIEFRTAPLGTAGATLTLTERMRILENGNIGIGTTAPAYKLDVAGDIRATGTIKANEVKVTVNGADFVFDDDYRLRSLADVEEFITTNKHLPDIAPAAEMEQNGLNMGEFQIKLLQKIEELTLYTIEQQKQIETQSEQIRTLTESIEKLNQTIKP